MVGLTLATFPAMVRCSSVSERVARSPPDPTTVVAALAGTSMSSSAREIPPSAWAWKEDLVVLVVGGSKEDGGPIGQTPLHRFQRLDPPPPSTIRPGSAATAHSTPSWSRPRPGPPRRRRRPASSPPAGRPRWEGARPPRGRPAATMRFSPPRSTRLASWFTSSSPIPGRSPLHQIELHLDAGDGLPREEVPDVLIPPGSPDRRVSRSSSALWSARRSHPSPAGLRWGVNPNRSTPPRLHQEGLQAGRRPLPAGPRPTGTAPPPGSAVPAPEAAPGRGDLPSG